MNLRRRRWLAGSAALIGLPALPGCGRRGAALPEARWIGASHERGHRLRAAKSGALPAPAVTRRAGVLVAGSASEALLLFEAHAPRIALVIAAPFPALVFAVSAGGGVGASAGQSCHFRSSSETP